MLSSNNFTQRVGRFIKIKRELKGIDLNAISSILQKDGGKRSTDDCTSMGTSQISREPNIPQIHMAQSEDSILGGRFPEHVRHVGFQRPADVRHRIELH